MYSSKTTTVYKDREEECVERDTFANTVNCSLAELIDRLVKIDSKLTELVGNVSTNSDAKQPQATCHFDEILLKLEISHRFISDIENKVNRIL